MSSSAEAIILAGDIDAGDVIVLPDAREAVLVKQVRLGTRQVHPCGRAG
jgi:hypothetical protein